jgi:hypothetical protein
MQFFLDYIEENQWLKGLFDWISKTKGHQGTVIRFSGQFLTMFELAKLLPKDDIPSMFYRYERYERYGFDFFDHFSIPLNIHHDISTVANISLSDLANFKRLIPNNIDNKYFRPLEVVISIFNDSNIEDFEKIRSEYAHNDSVRIVIERRSRNTFLNSKKPHNPLVGGISIGINDDNLFGTLGGFIESINGDIYGVTCSHVGKSKDEDIYHPSKFDSQRYRKIGKVAYASTLNYCDSNSECNSSNQGNIDVSLIKLLENESVDFSISQLGKVSKRSKFKDILQGQKVEFNGRSTNERKQLSIGGLCVSYKVAYDESQYVCFTNLIELRSTPTQILGTNYFISESPVKSGDSGAWICSNDSDGYSWCGMLICGDIDRGYFLSTEHILEWLNNEGYHFSMS